MGKEFTVGTFCNPSTAPSKSKISCYLRDYNPAWAYCIEYKITAKNGAMAKSLATRLRLEYEFTGMQNFRSKPVKRYDMIDKPFHFGANMEPADDGEWVDYEDYAKLEKQLDEAREETTKLEKDSANWRTIHKAQEEILEDSEEQVKKLEAENMRLFLLLDLYKVPENDRPERRNDDS